MCYCDAISPSAYTRQTRKARIRHNCCECWGYIKPGSKYEEVTGVWDHRPNRYRTCVDCVAVRNLLVDCAKCFCWSHGGLWEEIDEAIDDQLIPGVRFGLYRLLVAKNRRQEEARERKAA